MGHIDRQSGEWVADDDATEKSAFTNSFRRAAKTFGFARELYNEGIALDIADLYGMAPVTSEGPKSQVETLGNGHAPPQPGEAPVVNGQGRLDIRPPIGKTGKAIYAWLKKCEEHFRFSLLNSVIEFCKSEGWPTRTDELDVAQVNELIQRTIRFLRDECDGYRGELDEYDRDDQEPEPEPKPDPRTRKLAPPPEPPPAPQAPPAPDLSNYGDPALIAIKKSISAATVALINRQTNRKPTQGEVIAAIGEMAAKVPNGKGHRGEVLDSLKDCNDAAWLKNILAEANRQIKDAASFMAEDAEGPI
jgi:hypothetical protein